MRIAVITNMPRDHQVEFLGAISKEPACDIHVFFLCRLTHGRQWAEHLEPDFPHTFVPMLPVHNAVYLNFGLLPALRRFKPDLVILGQYANVAMQMTMYYASMARVPWVLWTEPAGVKYSDKPLLKSERTRLWLRRLALLPPRRWAREIWAISDLAQQQYSDMTEAPCHRLDYYSDLSRFLAIKREGFEHPVRFLCSGSLSFRKGIDLVAEAVRRLAEAKIAFTITFMGDGPLLSDVEDLRNDFPDQVSIAGFKEIAEVAGVLAQHDVLVTPSRYDGWGMVVPEALAAGMPVVATNAMGAASEMVDTGVNGHLSEALSSDALFRAMLALAKNPGAIFAMGLEARRTAKQISAEVGARRFAALAQSACEPP